MRAKNMQASQGESEISRIRILVVDPNPVARRQLTRLISRESDFVVCAEAENADQALGAIQRQQVDLAIVDTSLEGTTCAGLVEKIKLQYPNISVVTISTRFFLNKQDCQ